MTTVNNKILICRKLNIFLNVTTKLALVSCVLCREQHLKIKYVNRLRFDKWEILRYSLKIPMWSHRGGCIIYCETSQCSQPSTTQGTYHGSQLQDILRYLQCFQRFGQIVSGMFEFTWNSTVVTIRWKSSTWSRLSPCRPHPQEERVWWHRPIPWASLTFLSPMLPLEWPCSQAFPTIQHFWGLLL